MDHPNRRQRAAGDQLPDGEPRRRGAVQPAASGLRVATASGGPRIDAASGLRVAAATRADVAALSALEQQAFEGDRISLRSWRALFASRSASLTLARTADADGLAGAAVVLRRKGSSIARLYSISVAPAARGRGVAAALLADAVERARDSGAALMRLETRVDNHAAQQLFAGHGFSLIGRTAAYYQDGTDALRLQKSLWNSSSAGRDVAANAPFYGQTLDFTCGPCALLMAMAAIEPATSIDRVAEIRLWREATTIFMAAGHGGCGPFGLALAAVRRGFHACVYAPAGHRLFVDSVRDPRKKAVIALVEGDFRSELERSTAAIESGSLTPQRLVQHLREGGVPLVLISLWRLHGEKGPHWVVVTGFDGHVFRILDPIAPPSPGDTGDPGVAVSVDEFKRITRYGRRRQTAAVIISKGP